MPEKRPDWNAAIRHSVQKQKAKHIASGQQQPDILAVETGKSPWAIPNEEFNKKRAERVVGNSPMEDLENTVRMFRSRGESSLPNSSEDELGVTGNASADAKSGASDTGTGHQHAEEAGNKKEFSGEQPKRETQETITPAQEKTPQEDRDAEPIIKEPVPLVARAIRHVPVTEGELDAKRKVYLKARKEYHGFNPLRRILKPNDQKVLENLQKAEDEYKQVQAEYVGSSYERSLAEKQKLVDDRFEVYAKKGIIRTGYDAYKKLSDYNLLNWYERKSGKKVEGKVNRFLLRTANVKTLTSGALLLGGSILASPASVSYLGIMTARGALSFTGASVGSYDLMTMGRNGFHRSRIESRLQGGELLDVDTVTQYKAEIESRAMLDGKTAEVLKQDALYQQLCQREEELFRAAAQEAVGLTPEQASLTPEQERELAFVLSLQLRNVDTQLQERLLKERNARLYTAGAAVATGYAVSTGIVLQKVKEASKWAVSSYADKLDDALQGSVSAVRSAWHGARQVFGQEPAAPAAQVPLGQGNVSYAQRMMGGGAPVGKFAENQILEKPNANTQVVGEVQVNNVETIDATTGERINPEPVTPPSAEVSPAGPEHASPVLETAPTQRTDAPESSAPFKTESQTPTVKDSSPEMTAPNSSNPAAPEGPHLPSAPETPARPGLRMEFEPDNTATVTVDARGISQSVIDLVKGSDYEQHEKVLGYLQANYGTGNKGQDKLGNLIYRWLKDEAAHHGEWSAGDGGKFDITKLNKISAAKIQIGSDGTLHLADVEFVNASAGGGAQEGLFPVREKNFTLPPLPEPELEVGPAPTASPLPQHNFPGFMQPQSMELEPYDLTQARANFESVKARYIGQYGQEAYDRWEQIWQSGSPEAINQHWDSQSVEQNLAEAQLAQKHSAMRLEQGRIRHAPVPRSFIPKDGNIDLQPKISVPEDSAQASSGLASEAKSSPNVAETIAQPRVSELAKIPIEKALQAELGKTDYKTFLTDYLEISERTLKKVQNLTLNEAARQLENNKSMKEFLECISVGRGLPQFGGKITVKEYLIAIAKRVMDEAKISKQ